MYGPERMHTYVSYILRVSSLLHGCLCRQHAGNMDRVFEWVICSEPALDSHRFMDAVEAAIKDGELETNKTGAERYCCGHGSKSCTS